MKYPFAVEFKKSLLPRIEKELIKSGEYQLPVKVTTKRLKRTHLYIIITRVTYHPFIDGVLHNQYLYKAYITHEKPSEESHTYLQNNVVPKNIAALFTLAPDMVVTNEHSKY